MENLKKLAVREVQLIQLELMKLIDKYCSDHGLKYYLIGGSCLGAVRHKGFIPWDDDIDIALMRKDYDKLVAGLQRYLPKDLYAVQNYETDKAMIPALTRICIIGTFVDIKSEHHLKNWKYTYIDVFPLDNVPDSIPERDKQRKQLQIIDRLIQLKQYHLYRDSVFEVLLKKAVSACLSIIPLKYLQNKRVKTMSKYKGRETINVCSTTSRYGYLKQVINRNIYGEPARLSFEGELFCVPQFYNEYLTHLFGANYMQLPPEDKRVKPQSIYADIDLVKCN